MSTGRDDDALRWDGDDDPTLDVGSLPEADPERGAADTSEPLALPDGYQAVGKGSEKVGHIESDGTVTMPGDAQPMSNGTLVTLGILAGAYLLFTIGWIIGGIRLQGTAQFLVSPVGYQVSFWLAVAAPALWFLTTYLLTRASKSWVRIVWLIAGLVVLIPWPFVMVGAVGQ
ncbi:DNA polymerase III subunit gamma/tau [Microbacterium sp. bgisy203]|uniref:DNA polymerase III subunit gamma/tau n=1 Tax=Microbacterium sp. bgisy203 TaxID=3413799 RepID=UPI003D729F47